MRHTPVGVTRKLWRSERWWTVGLLDGVVILLDHNIELLLVGSEVDIWAHDLDLVLAALKILVVGLLADDDLVGLSDLSLHVLEHSLRDFTAWVLLLALLEPLPRVLHDSLGLQNTSLNLGSERRNDVVPHIINSDLGLLLNVFAAFGTFGTGVEEFSVGHFGIVVGGLNHEVLDLSELWLDLGREPVLDLGLSSLDVVGGVVLGVNHSDVVVPSEHLEVGVSLGLWVLLDGESGGDGGSEDEGSHNNFF